MPIDPLEEARRERSLLRGLFELTPLGQAAALGRGYRDFAQRERGSGSLVGDYLTALEPIEQIGSDLFESGQMVGDAIQAGTGALAGLVAPDAYSDSYADRLRGKNLEPGFDPLAIGSYLESAPGPGDVIAESIAPGTPESAGGRVAKTFGALAGNMVLDPSNLATGGLGAAGDLARSGKFADAAAQLVGSPVAAAVYAPDIFQGVTEGSSAALDPSLPMEQRLEGGANAILTGGLGALAAHGMARDFAPGSISERVALKKAAKEQGLDDVPSQPVAPVAPVEAAPEGLPVRGPEALPEPVYEAPAQPQVQPQQVVEAPQALPPDLAVAPERPVADIEASIPPVEIEPASPEPPSAPPESTAFQFPLDEVAPEVRPIAEQAAVDLATRFAGEGRFDQAALDEALAASPDLAPFADQIKRHAVLEGSSLIQGRWALDEAREAHGAGPDGIERVETGPESYDIVQRSGGQVVGVAKVENGTLAMVAGGRKMGSPESIRPVFEALDAAGAKRNDQLTILGAGARRTKASRDAAAAAAPGLVSGVPDATGAGSIRPEPRPGDAGGIREQAQPAAPRHPLDSDDPLPIRTLIDTARQRFSQHERTRAPEQAVANDLGSAVYHVVASGLKRTMPQVRGWVKRHLGTWLRKVGFAGEKLNQAIARAYDAAKTRWASHQERMKATFGDPERGSTSAVSRDEIDRQLRSNPELAGMARAQLEAVAKSAKKPIAQIHTDDIRKAFPGTDDQSKATRAMLNRIAAAERLKDTGGEGGDLTPALKASLAHPTAGPKRLDNPRSKSGKVRESLPEPARKAVETHEPKARQAVGDKEVLTLADLDEGVRGALRLKTDADLKRMLGGRRLDQSEVAAFKLSLQDQKIESFKRLNEWRGAKDDKSRAAAMSEYIDSQLVQAANLRAFAGDTPSAARIEKARSTVRDTDAVRKMFASLRPETRATITDRQAATIASLMRETMEGRRPASELGEAIQAATRPTGLDKVLEWWKAGLLSGPPTHIANFLGNTTNLLLDIAKTGVAGGIDAIASRGNLGSPKKARERYVSDVGASLHGMMGAIGPAMRQFARDVGDMATLRPEKFDLASGRFEHQVGAIKGVKGRLIRTPFRALGAADGFFRTLLNASEQFKEANRAIERRIETGDVDRSEKGEFMADWLDKLRDPENAKQFEAVKGRIETEVRKGLFQQDADELTRYVQRVLHTPVGKLGQFFVPFVSTPVNILKTTARYTPAGALAARLRANRLTDAAANATAIDDMAKGLVGTIIGAGLLGLAQQGLITGSGPTDPRDRALKEKTGWKPRSLVLKTGDTSHYIPIDRIEPLGTLFGLVGDIVELKDERKSGDAFSKLVGMVKDNALEKSYLEGLSNLFELASDPERHGPSFLRSFAGSWVPAISGRLAQGLDPVMRDTRGDGDSPMARIADSVRKSIQARIPVASESLPARRDPTGAPQTRSGNFVTRALIPSAISEEKTGPEANVAKELLRINYTPGEPRREMKISGHTIELTSEEFAKLEGAKEQASAEVARVMRQAEYQRLPDSVEEGGQASKEAVVRRIYQGYQERARHELYRQPRLAKERRKAQAQRMPNVRIQFKDR